MSRGAIALAVIGGGAALLYYLNKQGTFSGTVVGEAISDVSSAFDPVDSLAKAIATAEGFYVDGSRPQRDHNPGDMTADLIGRGVGTDGPFIVFATDDDGWSNLKAQIQKWFDGSSKNADSSSTIADLSGFYTNTEQDSWASNVAKALGVSTDTSLSDLGGS
jgi:hypothetical protein